jgi:competence protein ComEA
MEGWLERNRLYIMLALVAVIVPGALLLWLRRPQPAPIIISTPVPTATPLPIVSPTPPPTVTPSPLRVYVTGAVQTADVYILPPGSIVKDAIHAAGGATSDADLQRINLAVQVHDQQQIYVPYQGESTPASPLHSAPLPATSTPSSQGAGRSSTLAVININTADAAALETLPGIGPTFAARIIDYREQNGPFSSVEDLIQVKGIGPATLDKMRDLLVVR